LGWCLGAGCAFGSVTVSTPLSRLALMSSSMMLSGSAKERQKETEALRWAACWHGVGREAEGEGQTGGRPACVCQLGAGNLHSGVLVHRRACTAIEHV
jgi:hypothetical protein